MSKNLAGLIQILGAGAVGYMQGKKLEAKENEAKADRESERAFLNEQRGRERSQWAEQDSMKQAIRDSQSDIVVEEVPGVDPNYNVASMTGEREPGTPAPASAGFKVAGQSFGDRDAAQQALHGVNSQASKYQRAAKALAERGQLEQAQKYEAFAKSAISEGTDQILGAISATAPKVEDVKKAGGMVASTIGADAADIFNKTGGKWRVTPDTVVQHFVDKDAAGREFVNSRVVGKDGKPVVEDVRAAGMMLADFKTRLAQQNADTKTFQDGQQQAEVGRHNKAVETETSTNNRATRANQAATLGIQRERLNLERNQFKKQTPQGQIETIEEITGVKLSVDEKKSFLGIGKGKDKKVDEITAKLVADSVKMFQENNPTATTGQLATFRATLIRDIGAATSNVEVENTLKDEFRKHDPGSAGYAQTYAEAKTELGMSDAALAALGYAAPKAAPARMAAKGATVRNPVQADAPARGPAAPFRGTPRTTGARQQQEAQEAAQAQAQEKAGQRATLARNIAQIEKTLAAGTGNALFQQTAKTKLARYQNELAALEGVAGQ